MTKLEIGEGVRQGDVYVFRIEDGELPDLTPVEAVKGEHVLAYGESTGHQHSIKESDSELYYANDNLFELAKYYGAEDYRNVTHGLRIIVDNTDIIHGNQIKNFSDYDHHNINFHKGDHIVLRPCEYSDEEEFKAIAD